MSLEKSTSKLGQGGQTSALFSEAAVGWGVAILGRNALNNGDSRKKGEPQLNGRRPLNGRQLTHGEVTARGEVVARGEVAARGG